jgi:hypothetical protein
MSELAQGEVPELYSGGDRFESRSEHLLLS